MYENNAILSKTFLFWFRAVYELWLLGYGPKNVTWYLSNTPFCVYFKYNWKTTAYWQPYYKPNDSSTTEDALFHVKSAKAVATYKLWPCANITVLLFCVQVWMTTNSGCLRLYYNTVTTAFLPRLHIIEIQTEVQLTSCHPEAIAVSLHYMYAIVIQILHTDNLHVYIYHIPQIVTSVQCSSKEISTEW